MDRGLDRLDDPVHRITTEHLLLEQRLRHRLHVRAGRLPPPGGLAANRRPSLSLAPLLAGRLGPGPQVSPEYKDAPEANTKAKIRHGDEILHRMGDLGYFDEQGRLWFCGRKAHRVEAESGLIPAVPVEGVYNEHPAVFRSALVGLGAPGRQIPVLCVELEPGQDWTPDIEDELRSLATDTRWDGAVQRMLPHPGFPTDARHNSKIRREDLRQWAQNQCPDLAPQLVRP